MKYRFQSSINKIGEFVKNITFYDKGKLKIKPANLYVCEEITTYGGNTTKLFLFIH